jgi:gliding motility-associated-like protein
LTAGNYTFTVTSNGCTSAASTTTATINATTSVPTLSLSSQTNVSCFGGSDGSITLTSSGGTAPYLYSWSPNVSSSLTASGLNAGTYIATVTDDNGCTGTTSVTVTQPASAVSVSGNVTDVGCDGTPGAIATNATGGTGPYTYSWSPSGGNGSGITVSSTGTYVVTVTDDNGCTSSGSYTVGVTGNLVISVDPISATIVQGGQVTLNASGASSYTWTPSTGLSCSDCPSPVASPDQTTVYTVVGTSSNGCTGSETVLVTIETECGEIYVPTIFSPDALGADANNTLCVYGNASCISELKFEVYDRWGAKLFESTTLDDCWNGTYKEKEMNSGIYVYRLYVMLTDGTVIDQSGNTTLVR